MKNPIAFFLSLSLLLAAIFGASSCFYTDDHDYTPPYAAGIETSVTGRVWDDLRDKAIQDVTVDITELAYGPTGYIETKVDSTVTDEHGEYTMDFVTTGKGFLYELRVRMPGNYPYMRNLAGVPQDLEPGRENIKDFQLPMFTVVKAHIDIINNPNPPLRISTGYSEPHEIYLQSGPVTVKLFAMPNETTAVNFYAGVQSDTASHRDRRIVDLTNILDDTVSVHWVVDPSSF